HVMKAAPLLRAWVQRLKDQGVTLAVNHRWTGLTAPPPGEPGPLRFHFGEHPDIVSDAAILALGGASWPETGSDGKWPSLLQSHHVRITPWSPANCGWNANWPAEISQLAGTPLKNIVAKVGSSSKAGELVITKTGLEGGPLYHLGPTLRATHPVALTLDLKPTLSLGEVEDRLSSVKKNYVREASRRLNLCRAAGSLLKHLPALGPWRDPKLLAAVIKACPIPLTSPRPVSEAISSAGGVSWDEIDQSLMLRRLPGVYICGEMIDWEAPTGGYLLQASMATGRLAAHRASLRLRNSHL
ncbi:MAG: TIGR03862 family flavoprotein, partial [Verrucomicrobiota bacterium]